LFSRIPFIFEDKNDWEELADIDLHPKNPEVGKKKSLRTGRIYIESVDAHEIADGEEVTLMGWGNAIAQKVEKDTNGTVLKVVGVTNLSGSVKTTKRKLTWVAVPRDYSLAEEKAGIESDQNPVVVKLIEVDHLITVPSLEEGMVFDEVLRPAEDTWKETMVLGEAAMKNIVKGQAIQINRRGFYKCDRIATAESPMELIFIPDGRSKAASKLVGEV
jgi:glutamyl-tRNA synthetase